MNRVTIIVPIYNVEKYVIKCIDSLVNQTFENMEVWAISDGSPDKSMQLIKDKYGNNSKIKCIEKANGGYGSVLEYAISNIRSEYFLICDPDDWLEPNTIEILMKEAITNKLDIVVGDKYYVYNDSGDTEYRSLVNNFFSIKPNVVYTEDIPKFSFLDVSPHAKLYKTEIVQNINFPYKVSFTDFILYIIALTNCKRIEYVNKPLAYYLVDRPGNSMTEKNEKPLNSYIVVWLSAFEQLCNNKKMNSVYAYRMLIQYKITLLYYFKNSKDLYNDEYYTKILNIKNKLKIYKNDILKVINKFSFRYLDVLLLLSNTFSIKMYLKVNYLFNKKYR